MGCSGYRAAPGNTWSSEFHLPRNPLRRCLLKLPLLLLMSCFASPILAENLLVFAAASLAESLTDVASQYEKATQNHVVLSLGGSSALARQIENGAPADIFISADLDWMDYLDARKLILAETRVALLRNSLVLIAPGDSKTEIAIGPGFPLAEALGNRRLAIANPEHVPAGKYGRSALQSLSVWPAVENKLARTENVRAALTLVARGETPFGIVYRTDALVEPKVRIVGEFPAGSHAPIVYPAAMIASGKNPAARSFLVYLKSPPAQRIFEKHGFAIAN